MPPPAAVGEESRRGKASFIQSLAVSKVMLPTMHEQSDKQREGMRSGQNHGDWNQSIEKLREQWTEFTNEIFISLAEEEMKLRREEPDKHSERITSPREPQGAIQR
jgi:hypothetical protein